MNQKQKKKAVVDLMKELTEIQSQAVVLKNKNVANGLKYILERILKETIDIEAVLYYIDSAMKKSKSTDSKVLWIKVFVKVKEYFDKI